MTYLDTLRKLAQAAHRKGIAWWLSTECENMGMHKNDAVLIAACSPERILAMLDVIEKAKAMRDAFYKNQGYWPQMGWTPTEFDAALAKLEESCE